MAEKQTRTKNFERSYSDSTGEIAIGHNEDTVASIVLSSINPDVLTKAAMRYVTDIVVGVGNAALKAEGGNIDKAEAKMAETIKALQDGTFKFRAASGQGGLSTEDEQQVIAEVIVGLNQLNKATGNPHTMESALAKIAEVYARTSLNAKGYTVRKDYNALKNQPQVKAALAKASKAGDNLDELLA